MGSPKPAPTSYRDAVEFLEAGRDPNGRPVANNTRLCRRGEDTIALEYHFTDVVTFHRDGRTVLDSGGWRTITTKERINWALPWRYPTGRHGFYIHQERRKWYLQRLPYGEGRRYVFEDGITINGNLSVSGAGHEDAKADNALRRRVSKYAKACADALPLEKPGPGDCWHCHMSTQGGPSLGDATKGTDHLDSHMAESYVVPSLVYRAMTEAGAGPAWFWDAFKDANDIAHRPAALIRDHTRAQVRRWVSRHVLKRYGFAS